MLAIAVLSLPVTAAAAQSIAHPEMVDGGKVSKVVLGGVLGGGAIFAGLLREEEGKETSSGGGEDNPKLTIGDRMKAAFASKESLQQAIADRDKTIAEDKTEIGRLTQANTDLRAQLDQANAKIATLEADAAEVEKSLKAAEAEAAKEKAANTTVEKKAQEKVASLGFPASKLPAAQESNTTESDIPSTRAELEQQMDKLKTLQERANLLARFEKAQAANSQN
jgi:chromosome segregation ATPase